MTLCGFRYGNQCEKCRLCNYLDDVLLYGPKPLFFFLLTPGKVIRSGTAPRASSALPSVHPRSMPLPLLELAPVPAHSFRRAPGPGVRRGACDAERAGRGEVPGEGRDAHQHAAREDRGRPARARCRGRLDLREVRTSSRTRAPASKAQRGSSRAHTCFASGRLCFSSANTNSAFNALCGPRSSTELDLCFGVTDLGRVEDTERRIHAAV